MKKRNSFLFGEGATGKYETQAFTQITSYSDNQRESCEVGILNILLWTGIIGVLLTAAVIFVGSYISIVHSNNYLCRTLGVFLMFHWVMLFVEEFSFFDLNNLFYWLIFGLAMSSKFRRMNNREVKFFFSQLVTQDNFKFISIKRNINKSMY